LPKQVTDFVARTMSEQPSDNPCTDGRKLTPPNENSLTASASPKTHCPEHRHDNALQLVL
jgi:hypothetical protein